MAVTSRSVVALGSAKMVQKEQKYTLRYICAISEKSF